MSRSTLQYWAFIAILIAVSIAFVAMLRPFYGAIFWAAALAVLFWPTHQRILARLPGRPTLAALLTLLLCLLIVIIPLTLVAASFVQEIMHLYVRFNREGSSLADYMRQIGDGLPAWLWPWLERFGLNNMAGLQERLSQVTTQVLQFAVSRALSIGQNTLQVIVMFVLMLYLLFFFFRDGSRIMQLLRSAIPIERAYIGGLADKYASVVKATIKGNLIVAGIQGALGGVLFWAVGVQGALVWAVVMGFLSLLPAVGAWLVWAPVAVYLLATGAIAKGIIVIVVGAGVIGLVDNILRPILVGRETRMPDYLVLLSTLGGLSMFGLTGFVAGPMIAALFIAMWDFFIVRNATPETLATREPADGSTPSEG